MLYLIAIAAVVIVAASLYADYKWHAWMDARKREDRSGRP